MAPPHVFGMWQRLHLHSARKYRRYAWRTQKNLGSKNKAWRFVTKLLAPRCGVPTRNPADGARLALDQTGGVGVLYTGFSGLMQKFIKNNSKGKRTTVQEVVPVPSKPA
jgi:hypothetical protein